MAGIESIGTLRIYNSHVEPTVEFTVRLDDGRTGRGASPHGETIGIYETEGRLLGPAAVVETIRADGMFASQVTQESFDDYLRERAASFGRSTCYALSLALYAATRDGATAESAGGRRPRLCCNILNGGWHAYTNPVLSDFHEYLLVARTDDVDTVLDAHGAIQRTVREALMKLPKTVVSGNAVNSFSTADNRECIEFLLGVRDGLGLSDDFDLMIDAAGSNLRADEGYRLSITDGSVRSGEEFCEYWLGILEQYPVRFLEDPFGEGDGEQWTRLTTTQETCQVIGDDFYCSDAERIEAGAAQRRTHGVIIKPNQAGSVTAVRRAIETADHCGQTAIASHRSVSTEEPFEAILTCVFGAPYIKIGPLMTDYSSVIRLNEIIRLTAEA